MSENGNAETDPLQIRHGRKIWQEVVETKAATGTILDILNPGEESELLEAVLRIEAKVDLLMDLLLPPHGGTSAR